VIEARRAQPSSAEGLLAEEGTDLWEDWMRPADPALDDDQLLSTAYEALAKRRPKSRNRGRVTSYLYAHQVRIFRLPALRPTVPRRTAGERGATAKTAHFFAGVNRKAAPLVQNHFFPLITKLILAPLPPSSQAGGRLSACLALRREEQFLGRRSSSSATLDDSFAATLSLGPAARWQALSSLPVLGSR